MEPSSAERSSAMAATVAGMRDVLADQTRLIDACLHRLKLHQDGGEALASGETEVFRVVLTMIHMVGISGHSVLKLTEEVALQVRDAYPVARSVVETVANILFIMAGGRTAAERAMRHAEQKAFRDLDRRFEIGGMTITAGWSGTVEAAERQRLEGLAAEFTSGKGREKDWTDESLRQRLDAVTSAFPAAATTLLNAAVFNIYRHSSEVLHGSYFSAVHYWGLTSPGRTRPATTDDLRAVIIDHQFSVLMSVVFAYAALIECFAHYAGEAGLARLGMEQVERLRAFPCIAEGLARSAAEG